MKQWSLGLFLIGLGPWFYILFGGPGRLLQVHSLSSELYCSACHGRAAQRLVVKPEALLATPPQGGRIVPLNSKDPRPWKPSQHMVSASILILGSRTSPWSLTRDEEAPGYLEHFQNQSPRASIPPSPELTPWRPRNPNLAHVGFLHWELQSWC